MKKYTILLCLIIGVTAKASSSSKSKGEFLVGSAPKDASADKIESDLTRDDYISTGMMGMNTLRAKVYPISDPFIEAFEAELGKKNMDSADEIAKNIQKSKNDLSNEKTCFNVFLESTISDIETATFKNWKLKLEQPKDNFITLELSNLKGVDSVPKGDTLGTAQIWRNTSAACTAKKIDLTQGFKLHLIPQFRDITKKISLEWK